MSNNTETPPIQGDVTITLPTQIRHLNDGLPCLKGPHKPTCTVLDYLANLPKPIQERVFHEGTKQVRRTLNVFVNEEQCTDLNQVVNAGDEISLLAASAGG